MTVTDLATIIAILTGPIVAVILTRWLDEHRAKRARLWDILRALMRYRRTPLNAEFVGALNLLEVEFANDQRVIEAWRQLLAAFNKLVPPTLSEEQFAALNRERLEAQTRLLDAIAKNLGVQIEQLDIQSGGYSPKGWADLENEQTAIRRLVGEIVLGKRALNVTVWPPPQPSEEQPRQNP